MGDHSRGASAPLEHSYRSPYPVRQLPTPHPPGSTSSASTVGRTLSPTSGTTPSTPSSSTSASASVNRGGDREGYQIWPVPNEDFGGARDHSREASISSTHSGTNYYRSSSPRPSSSGWNQPAFPTSSRSYTPLPEKARCLASVETDVFRVIHLGSSISPLAMKERIMSGLHIPDDDFPLYSFHLDDQDSTGTGEEELWEACKESATQSRPVTVFIKLKEVIRGGGGRRSENFTAISAQDLMQQHSSRPKSPSSTSKSSMSSHPYERHPQDQGRTERSSAGYAQGMTVGTSQMGGNLSPPADWARERQGSTTPVGEHHEHGMRRASAGDYPPPHNGTLHPRPPIHQHSVPGPGSHGQNGTPFTMYTAAAGQMIRPLPPVTPAPQQSDPRSRQASGPLPNMLPPAGIRPLPPMSGRVPQAPPPGSYAFNSQQPYIPPVAALSPPMSRPLQSSRSAIDMRSQYSATEMGPPPSFRQQQGPPPGMFAPPLPPRGTPAPQVMPVPRYPTSQPAGNYSSSQQPPPRKPSQPQVHYPPYDPRLQRPNTGNGSPSMPVMVGHINNGSFPGQGASWANSSTYRPPPGPAYNHEPPRQASRPYDPSKPIALQPGETLQDALKLHAHQPHHSSQNRPPTAPSAAHMRVTDPSEHAGLRAHANSPYPVSSHDGQDFAGEGGSYRPSGHLRPSDEGSQGSSSSRQRFRDNSTKPPSASSLGPKSPRSSASSSNSTPWGYASTMPSSFAAEDDPYGGMAPDDGPTLQSPTSIKSPASTRSSVSASKPHMSPPLEQHFDKLGSPSSRSSPTAHVNPTLSVTEAPIMARLYSDPIPSRSTASAAEPVVSTTDSNQWAAIVARTFSGDGDSTLQSAGEGTMRPAATEAPTSASSDDYSTRTFDDEDDNFGESTLWNVRPSAPVSQPSSPQSSKGGVRREFRPALKVTTDLSVDDQSSSHFLPSGPSSRGKSASGRASAVSNESKRGQRGDVLRVEDLSGLSISPLSRQKSFKEREQEPGKNWAFRPPVDQVYENLEVFFPEHDLDQPIVDARTPVVGTPPAESPSQDDKSPVDPLEKVKGSLRYKKSIRKVAQDRKRVLQKVNDPAARAAVPVSAASTSSAASALLRRKSTKLWGTRIEEVTPAQAKKMSQVAPTSPIREDPETFSFKWVKGQRIGRGTFGSVYVALNVTTGDMMAVKQVELGPRDDDRSQGMVDALRREMETLKDLDHPKIVQYLGFEESIRDISIFLEYVPGGSLGKMIQKHGKFEEEVIKSFMRQILEGLEYLHNHDPGILHRDLKCDNILCDHAGNVKIGDFGTAKVTKEGVYSNANMSVQGTVFWMAPEVLRNGGEGYSAKADIWALGCIFIEMFAGKRPWSEDEFYQAMYKLGAERKAPSLPADIVLSENPDHFLHQCLKIEPQKRPTATKLRRHVFLVHDGPFNFQETSLFRAITKKVDPKPSASTSSTSS